MNARPYGIAVIALAALSACPQSRGPAAGDPGGATSSPELQRQGAPGHAQGAAPPAPPSSTATVPSASSPAPQPAGAGSAVSAPASLPGACRACPAGALRVKLDTNAIIVGGQELPLAPKSSHRASADPAALERCLKGCAGSKLAISAGSDVNACFAGDVLRAAIGTTFQTAELEVDGRRIGTYQVAAARADLKLTSMQCGPRNNVSTWIRDVARLRGVAAPKSMELSVNYGCTLGDVMPTLRALSGKGLDLRCHFGPY